MLDIVIVNWNSGEQLLTAIKSVLANHENLVESVVVVDNASSDNSVELLGKLPIELGFDLKVIRNKENRGFGAACNEGARNCNSELILFLNPDAQLYTGSLLRPLEYIRASENQDVGIVGIQLVDESGHVAHSCSRFPSLSIFFAQILGINRLKALRSLTQAMVEWPHDSTREVDQVIGAFFLTRRVLFNALKGFDERFFVYFEEVDFSYRAKLAGYKSIYLADAQAFHAGGGTSSQVKARRLFYVVRSRLLYGFKHFDRIHAWTLLLLTLLLEPISRACFALPKSGFVGVKNTFEAFGMLCADLPSILKRKID